MILKECTERRKIDETLIERGNLRWRNIQVYQWEKEKNSTKLIHVTSTSIFLLWESGICSTSTLHHFLSPKNTRRILLASHFPHHNSSPYTAKHFWVPKIGLLFYSIVNQSSFNFTLSKNEYWSNKFGLFPHFYFLGCFFSKLEGDLGKERMLNAPNSFGGLLLPVLVFNPTSIIFHFLPRK